MEQKKLYSTIGIAYFLLSVITIGLQYLLEAIFYKANPGLLNRDAVSLILSLAPMYLVAMPVCRKWMQRIDSVKLKGSTLTLGRWSGFLLISIFIMYVGNIIGNLLCSLISAFTGLNLELGLEDLLTGSGPLVTLIVSVLLAPILEELVFRKLLIDRAIVLGDKATILLSGLMFGLFHGNLYQFFYAFGLGCLFAYIYIRTGKIRYTIALHMSINFLGGFLPVLFQDFLNLNSLIGRMQSAGILYMSQLRGLVCYYCYIFLMLLASTIGLILFLVRRRRAVFLSGELEQTGGQAARSMLGNPGMWLFFASCAYLFVVFFIS